MKKVKQTKLRDILRKVGIANVARKMGLSFQSVDAWKKVDGIPQRRVLKLSEVLDEDPLLLQSMVSPITYKVQRVVKTPEALDTVLAAFHGEPYEIKPPLTAKSLSSILTTYGDKTPLMVDTMKKLLRRELTNKQAAERLGISERAVYGLRARYGMKASVYRVKVERPLGPYKLNAIKVPKYIKPIIEGVASKVEVVKKVGVPDRTISRYLAKALNGYTLKQLAHWPQSFRMAFAYEIEHGLPRLVPHWVEKVAKQGWKPPKHVGNLEPVTDWRLITTKRMLFCILNGEMDVKELAELRGADPIILHKLFDMELKHLDLTFSQVIKLSMWHQIAVMDMLRMSGRL